MNVRTGKFQRAAVMSRSDWLASPIWELRLRDDEYHARPVREPSRVTRELLRGRRIVILVHCEQLDGPALAEVRTMRRLDAISVFGRGGRQRLDSVGQAKFPFYVVAVPSFGRAAAVRFVWKNKGARLATRIA